MKLDYDTEQILTISIHEFILSTSIFIAQMNHELKQSYYPEN